MNHTKMKKPSSLGRLFLIKKDVESSANTVHDAENGISVGRRMRATAVLKRYAALLALGIAYLVFCRTTGLSLPCPFHAVTGLDCPGCGITRLMLALTDGNFTVAFRANEALFLLGPLLLLFLLRSDFHWILHGKEKEPPRAFIIFLLIAFAIFTVWRNFLR